MGKDSFVVECIKTYGFPILLIFMMIGLIIFSLSVFSGYRRSENVTFNVTGISGPVNASTLVGVHFECIKYCSRQFYSDSYARDTCYAQCEKLGKETFGKD
jgi:hypothetical protein